MLGSWIFVIATYDGQIQQQDLGSNLAVLAMVLVKHWIVIWCFVIIAMQCMGSLVSQTNRHVFSHILSSHCAWILLFP
jgi:hypothetical protein